MPFRTPLKSCPPSSSLFASSTNQSVHPSITKTPAHTHHREKCNKSRPASSRPIRERRGCLPVKCTAHLVCRSFGPWEATTTRAVCDRPRRLLRPGSPSPRPTVFVVVVVSPAPSVTFLSLSLSPSRSATRSIDAPFCTNRSGNPRAASSRRAHRTTPGPAGCPRSAGPRPWP